MTMLTAQELADLRGDVLELLPDTCIIQRSSGGTADMYGHVAENWLAAGTVVCRMDPFWRTITGEAGAREALRNYHRLTVAYDADLRTGDRVSFSSDIYEIVELHDDHSLRAVRWALMSKIE
jgi:head-tail adaptor